MIGVSGEAGNGATKSRRWRQWSGCGLAKSIEKKQTTKQNQSVCEEHILLVVV